jgi:hypothetical protein
MRMYPEGEGVTENLQRRPRLKKQGDNCAISVDGGSTKEGKVKLQVNKFANSVIQLRITNVELTFGYQVIDMDATH